MLVRGRSVQLKLAAASSLPLAGPVRINFDKISENGQKKGLKRVSL